MPALIVVLSRMKTICLGSSYSSVYDQIILRASTSVMFMYNYFPQNGCIVFNSAICMCEAFASAQLQNARTTAIWRHVYLE